MKLEGVIWNVGERREESRALEIGPKQVHV
jgi:hypothetical protein